MIILQTVGCFQNYTPCGRSPTRGVGTSVVTKLCILLLAGVFGLGCNVRIAPQSVTGVWRASNDYGDKPGNGIELELSAGQLSGKYYILEPEKSDDFSSGVSFPLTLTKRSSAESMCEVPFNPAEVDKSVLKLPGKFPDVEFVATITDTEPGAELSSSSARSNDLAD